MPALAQTIISRRELIASLKARHDARCEGFAFAGLQTLFVQLGRDCRIWMMVEETIDGGDNLRAGLPLLPRTLWKGELNSSMGAALEPHVQFEMILS